MIWRGLTAQALMAAVAAVLVASASTPSRAQSPTARASEQPPRVNADALLSLQFVKRVEEYLALHDKLEATLPSQPKDRTPAVVDAHAHALARLIADARFRAKQGDLFTRETRAYFRRQIGRALAGPDGPVLRSSIREENPGKIQLRVNARYPDGIPVTTMPPPIIAALPKLPQALEYRFIGDRLILLDIHAMVIVDYFDDAIPS